MANKISVILDVVTDKAISGLKGFKQSVAEADGAFGKVKAGAGSAFDSIKQNAGLASVAVVGAVGAMAAKSIKAASDLGESINAVNVTFGPTAAGIKALGEEAAESVGLSNSAFNGLAVQFSSFADTIAGKGGDVVGTIDDMTTRAADFASVMNIDVADAARIFQSGLAGETEPLKKFGIDLSAATVETYALANGIIGAGESMTEAQKIQARYGLLMEKTEKTAGDFANTSDGLANSQRILAAKMEDTAAKAGKQLAPAVAAVTSALSDMIPIAGTAAVKVGGLFTGLTEAAYDFGGVLADITAAIPGVTLSGEGVEVEHTLHDLAAMEAGAQGLVDKYVTAGMTVGEFREELKANGVVFTEANFAVNAYAKTLEGTTAATGEATGATDDLTVSTEKSTLAHWDATEAAEAIARADEEATEAALAHVEAIEDQIEATTALVGGDIAVRDAQRAATEAVLALTAAHVAGTPELDGAASALINAAEQAANYDESLGNANGVVLSAFEKNQLLKTKLEELAATLAPGSPLRVQIQGYIDDLLRIPGSVPTSINLINDTRFGRNARGTSNWRGGVTLVGEEGPELVALPSGSAIHPAGETQAMLNGAGGATLIFNSNGPPTIADISHALAMARLSR